MNSSSGVQPPQLDRCSASEPDRSLAREVSAAVDGLGDAGEVAVMFGLLADPNRLRLLVALLVATELCVCDLAAAAGMSESATSHALRLLRAHRVVQVRRSGRMAYYRLADDHVRQLLEVARSHVAHGAAAGAVTGMAERERSA